MKTLRVLASKGTPGNPKERPRDLINHGDKGVMLDDETSLNIFYAGKCVSICHDGTVSVSDDEDN